MQLIQVAEVTGEVARTSSRLAKRDLLAGLLSGTPAADLAVVVTYLSGELRQRRTGVGWASLSDLPEAATEPTLEVADVDAELERIAGLSGPGSAGARKQAVTALFAAATAPEQRLLRGLLSGEVRQGALDAAIIDAVAQASGVAVAVLRRAVMLRGSTAPVAEAALTTGVEAVTAITAAVGQPLRPMLASSAPDVVGAFDRLAVDGPVAVDSKLDGIRIQAHRWVDPDGAVQVRLHTRSLDDITDRLPDVAEVVAALPVTEAILDGEVLAADSGGTTRPFQETASRAATQAGVVPGGLGLVPAFFDLLWLDGEPLVDLPLTERLQRLERVVPETHRVRRLVTADPAETAAFFDEVVAAGLEGVVVKRLDAPYEAGRRGAAWVKVKPRHTLDLVVLGVEQGSGRRRGWLSNIHLGARDAATGDFVMLGKTFKGMTDEMLRWQTARFTELAVEPAAVSRGDWVVELRPEQVVEIAFDGVQRSTRYPGGVALRFARVLRYRDDKSAAEVDSLEVVRGFLP